MSKIYIVTDGSYSDYRILGAYSTKELAEKAIVLYNADNPVEEWNVDAFPDWPCDNLPFNCWMDLDGKNAVARRISVAYAQLEDIKVHVDYRGNKFLSAVIAAENEKHAIKILNEKRIQYLAERNEV